MTVSVVIPAYNAAATLPACLAALQRQTLMPIEILVVDDGSTDGTALFAAAAGAHVIQQDHQNQAAARNRGAAAATGDLVLFTDADCVPADDWVERLTAPFGDPTVVAAKGRYITAQPGIVPRFIQHEFEEKYRRLASQPSIDFVDSYSAAYRRQVFLEAGGFDAAFPVVEDIELSFRLAQNGHRLVFAQDAVVRHSHRESVIAYLNRKREAGFWWVAVYGRHPAKVGSDSRQPRTVMLQIALAGAIGGLAVLAKPIRGFRGPLGLLIAAFGLTTVPTARRIAATDPTLAVAAPLLTFGRSFAQGLGVVQGLISRQTK